MANEITEREVIKANKTYIAYLRNELDLLNKEVQNISTKFVILETLAIIGSGTITDIQNASEELGALSNQKILSLIRQLVDAKEIVKTIDKKKSIFSLPTESENEED